MESFEFSELSEREFENFGLKLEAENALLARSRMTEVLLDFFGPVSG